MDRENNGIELYSSQTKEIAEAVRGGKVHLVKIKFIREKYKEVAHIFMTVYNWYAAGADKIVPRPEGAESGIWAFANPKMADRDPGSSVMKLSVPEDRVVLFRMSEWNRILNLRYLGENAEERERFAAKLEKYGIRNESDAVTKPFYPQLKQEIMLSWENLFRYDRAIKRKEIDFPDIQAGLWEIRREWVEDWNC